MENMYMTESTRMRTLESRRCETRHAMACEVEVRVGGLFSIRVRTQNISRGGSCVRLPGGASLCERYHVTVVSNDPDPFHLPAEVRWVGEPDAAGFAPVGLMWLDMDADAVARLETLMKGHACA